MERVQGQLRREREREREREEREEREKGKRKRWGNLLDRANMQDKAWRREWRGLVCVEVCRRYKIAVRVWASMTGQE